MISIRMLILSYAIQVIPNVCTKFQNLRCSSSWEIFFDKKFKQKILLEKKKNGLSYKGTCHVILLAKLHDMYLYKTTTSPPTTPPPPPPRHTHTDRETEALL